jgi:kynurenine formamidase
MTMASSPIPPRPAPETPIGAAWWPSRYGADDQRGAANLMTPARALAATRLIHSGEVLQLGRLYQREMPNFPHRSFHYAIPAGAPPEGENQRVGREDFFAGTLGQVGTQLDGLGHVGVRLPAGDTFYNGVSGAEMDHPEGLRRLGVEQVGVFFTRGVLVDLPAHCRCERLAAGTAITAAMLQGALAAQGLTLQVGDAVLLRTGHGQLWMVDNQAYNQGEPGLELGAAQWLIAQQPCLVGADNWGIEVHPPLDAQRPIEVHQWMITKHGIYFLENLDLEEAARQRCHEFAFIFAPLRLKGGVGSPGNPIAVR